MPLAFGSAAFMMRVLRDTYAHYLMTPYLLIFASLAIMFASFSGKLLMWGALGRFMASRLRYLVALATGVFSVIVYGLVDELLHEGLELGIVVGFIIGAIFLELLSRFLPKGTHHHHGPHPEHTHTRIDARRMLLGDAIHNMHDGLALVPAFLVSPVVGIGTAVGVFLHEVVQETAEFFVLREAGYSVRAALAWNFLVSATLIIGVVIAASAASYEEFAHPLVAFAAGGLTYVLLRDLIPSVVRHARTERSALPYATMVLLGALLMGAVAVLFPHEEHEDEALPLPDGFELAIR